MTTAFEFSQDLLFLSNFRIGKFYSQIPIFFYFKDILFSHHSVYFILEIIQQIQIFYLMVNSKIIFVNFSVIN